MGTDIHFAVEARRPGFDWERIEEMIDNPYAKYDAPDDPQPSKVHDEWYGDRNYDVFAILADVRNGTGFAGVKTGGGYVPLSQGRGVPEDSCKGVRDWLGEEGYYHSVTWFDLDEFWRYDVTQVTTQSWMCDDEWQKNGRHYDVPEGAEYGDWAEHKVGDRGKADVYRRLCVMRGEGVFDSTHWMGDESPGLCGGISGGRADKYVRIEWPETYEKALRPFMPTIDKMTRYALQHLGGDFKAIRAVYGFDS